MAKYYTTTEELTSIANAIRTKGNTNSSLVYPTGFVSAIQNISTSSAPIKIAEKDVNFIDYDGTILYSYTAQEAQALTELPANPTHTGLTSHGWNWTLAEIKTQLTTIGGRVYVGQEYITASGATEIDIELEDANYLSPYLAITVNGTVTIDWGDSSNTDTLTGTSLSSMKYKQHIYASVGNYTIKITVTSGSFAFYSDNTAYAGVLREGSSGSLLYRMTYTRAIKHIRMGQNSNVKTRAFANCVELQTFILPHGLTSVDASLFYYTHSLKSLTIPKGVTTLSNYFLMQCYHLINISIPPSITTLNSYVFDNVSTIKYITIPYGVTSINTGLFYACNDLKEAFLPNIDLNTNSVFYNCRGLLNFTIPSNVTSIGTNAFNQCQNLTTLTIPSQVTSIGTNAFYSCYGMEEYHFLSTTPPTLNSTTAFSSIPSSCIIYVPYSEDHSVLNVYKTDTNWSTYASYMQEEPQS